MAFGEKKLQDLVIVSAYIVFPVKRSITKIAEFANTVDSDAKAHNELSHLDRQCLPSCYSIFIITFFFLNFADVILLCVFLATLNI